MVDQPLVQATDLEGFPGAPFPIVVVDAAAGRVRAEVGWHVAPQVTETLEVETGGATVALLPSLHVVSVSAVRNAEDGTVLDGWRVSKTSGVLTRKAGWPETIEVDLTHGYGTCPAELAAVVADYARQIKAGGRVRQQAAGPFSTTFDAGDEALAVLARYRLAGRP